MSEACCGECQNGRGDGVLDVQRPPDGLTQEPMGYDGVLVLPEQGRAGALFLHAVTEDPRERHDASGSDHRPVVAEINI
jgi:hypothetical protein